MARDGTSRPVINFPGHEPNDPVMTVIRSDSSLAEAHAHYVVWLRETRDLSTHTVRAYDSDVTALRRALGDHVPVAHLDGASVRAFFEDQRGKGLCVASLRRRGAGLRSFCSYLREQGVLPADPWADAAISFRRPRSLPRAVPTGDVVRLLEHLRERAEVGEVIERHRPLPSPAAATLLLAVTLMLSTGMRVGELVAIRLDDVDLSNQSIYVTGKGRRERVVYLPSPWLRDLIAAYLLTREALQVSHEHLLFGSPLAPLSAAWVRGRLARAASAAGLRRITPHMLRHTAATQLIESGVDIRFVQRLLGHASLSTTEIYTHITNDALRRAMTSANVLGRTLAVDN